ncbi:alanine racemase [Marinicella sp. W31]|uniref:alanine racemase n=1 Tax=Marinicella sp. W31 TaxID=3023713 RepID=UPI0037571E48
MTSSSAEMPDLHAVRHSGRGTTATIYLQKLRHNLAVFRELHHGPIIAVVKADAYGHGLSRVVPVLHEVEAFAVATLEEAQQVRALSRQHKIILLEGVFNAAELETAIEQRFDVVVHQDFQLELIQQCQSAQSALNVWIKIDTGMNRLGFNAGELTEIRQQLSHSAVINKVMLMTHFADSDHSDVVITQSQVNKNQELIKDFESYSLSNTAAVLNGLSDPNEWVRLGIGLFGIKQAEQLEHTTSNLQPVMQLSANILALKHVLSGHSIGYAATYTAELDMQIAIVGIGYADGYPWRPQMTAHALINGQKCPLVGRVSMDMLAVDVSALKDCAVGDEVILWGPELPTDKVAAELKLIPYVLTCGITRRVKFVYVDE